MSGTNEIRSDPSGKSLGEGLERIFAQTDSQGSVLDRALGPTARCYSIRHMVNLFRWGASEDDVDHLSRCAPCQRWANNYAETASAKTAPQEEAVKSLWQQMATWFRQPAQPIAVTPMLYVMGDMISVSPADVSMEVALIAGVSDPGRLDVGSLKLEGDLFSDKCTLLTQQIAGIEYPVVRFDGIQLADSLRRDVLNHVAVIENVSVTGRFVGDTEVTLRGQANVNVGRGGAALRAASSRSV